MNWISRLFSAQIRAQDRVIELLQRDNASLTEEIASLKSDLAAEELANNILEERVEELRDFIELYRITAGLKPKDDIDDEASADA